MTKSILGLYAEYDIFNPDIKMDEALKKQKRDP